MAKFYIPIILGSTRRERQSPKVARFVQSRLGGRENIETEIIDLQVLNLPIMEERLRFRNDPPPGLIEFSEKVNRADSIVIVTPEYKRKPFGIVTVSAGGFGGIHCLAQLRLVILGMGAFPIPASFPVSTVQSSFDADGNPKDPAYEKRAETFIAELLWFTEAVATQRAKSS